MRKKLQLAAFLNIILLPTCNSISLYCHHCFSKLLTVVSLRRIKLQRTRWRSLINAHPVEELRKNAFLLPTSLRFLAIQSAYRACPFGTHSRHGSRENLFTDRQTDRHTHAHTHTRTHTHTHRPTTITLPRMREG